MAKDSMETAANYALDTDAVEQVKTSKKEFVEPEINSPVDVLEATTFFASVTSGGTA